MLEEIKKRKKIAILRGGKKNYKISMKNGANIILSLLKYNEEVDVIDVVIDIKDNWVEKGIPSDSHRVFSKADYYIDFTDDFNNEYHKLAINLDVKLIFKNQLNNIFGKLNTKRVLNQIGFLTPKYVVFRDKINLKNDMKETWTKFYTPVVIKDINDKYYGNSLLTYSFLEAFNFIKNILDLGHEAILEEHLHGEFVSIAAIPNYRGEDIYISTPVETINANAKSRTVQNKILVDKYIIDHGHHKRSYTHISDTAKDKIKSLVLEIYNSLAFDNYILIDTCIDKNNNIKILEIHNNPHLYTGSRFNFILENSGIDLGKYILNKIDKIEENELIS